MLKRETFLIGGSYTTALGTSCKWLDDVGHVMQVAGRSATLHASGWERERERE